MDEINIYEKAGVNIEAGIESVNRIKKLCMSTFSPYVVSGIGAFGAVFDLKEALNEYSHPLLVQSIDGVGTKLMVASMLGNHSTVGKDIVNHSANDILCQGASPLTFMDYIAADKISPDHISQILEGMCFACKELNISLTGGELAELPGMYYKNQYDVAGCITGVVEKSEIITGAKISKGDIVLGLASSGLHTNGYSLVRKILFDVHKIPLERHMDEIGRTLGEELLKPHRSYTNYLKPFIKEKSLKGIAHITGGGFFDNPPRMLPHGKKIIIKKKTWEIQPVFKLIKTLGNISDQEMYRTFNMGIGLMTVVSSEEVDTILVALNESGIKTWTIGEVADGEKSVSIIE